jgi:hypothetical protein
MKKTFIALGFAAATSFAPQPRAQTALSQNLYFYGARLPSETVEVVAYAPEGDRIEIKGHVTMSSEQWVAFSNAVVQAGFPASQGEPTPVSTGRPK